MHTLPGHFLQLGRAVSCLVPRWCLSQRRVGLCKAARAGQGTRAGERTARQRNEDGPLASEGKGARAAAREGEDVLRDTRGGLQSPACSLEGSDPARPPR